MRFNFTWLAIFIAALTLVACQQEQVPTAAEADVETDPEYYVQLAEEAIAETEQQVLEHPSYSDAKTTVTVPAGSVDALQAAIDQAGPWGRVVVKAGMHVENSTVTITHPVRLIGEKGAVIESGIAGVDFAGGFPFVYPAAIFVNGADFVQIRNLELTTASAGGVVGIGIAVLNADRVYLRDNTTTDFASGAWSQNADDLLMIGNKFDGLLDKGINSTGFYHHSGDSPKLLRNESRDFETCFFVCDKDGLMIRNKTQGGAFGYILCKFPLGFFAMPDGTLAGADFTAEDWLLVGNEADGHSDASYQITDGAIDNLLVSNQSTNAALYDFNFEGDIQSTALGLRPAAVDNTYISGRYRNQVIKDCAINTTLIGNFTLIDNNVDPCRTTDD